MCLLNIQVHSTTPGDNVAAIGCESMGVARMNISTSSKGKKLSNHPTRLPRRRPHSSPDTPGCKARLTRTRSAPKRRKPVRTCGYVRGWTEMSGHSSISLEVKWRTGPRTREWNELWKDLLAELVTTFERQAAVGESTPAAPKGAAPKLGKSEVNLPHAEGNRVDSRDSQGVNL